MAEMEQLEKLAVGMRKSLRDEIDATTDSILTSGMSLWGFQWPGDKAHFDDYRDACQQITSGMQSEVLIHGVGQDAYVNLNSSNVAEFFIAGRDFKINTLGDGYKIKDLGGQISNGKTVKALKNMDYYELVYWTDPRL